MWKYLAQVWTGDDWHTLGVYQKRGNASARIERSKSNQEHRVVHVDAEVPTNRFRKVVELV